MSGSAPWASSGSSALAASNEETCTNGMKSGEKKARITWRIASVAITRWMPSLLASIEASVDLPTPGAPESRMIGGSRSLSKRCQPSKRRTASSPSCSRRTSAAISSSAETSTSPPGSSSSTALASSYARSGAIPEAVSDCAIRPFEYGRPWPDLMTIVSGIVVQPDQLGVEVDVEPDRAVAQEHDAGAALARERGDGVDAGGLDLGEEDIAARGGCALEVGRKVGAAREVARRDCGLDAVRARRAGREEGDAGAVRQRLDRLRPQRAAAHAARHVVRDLGGELVVPV